MKRLNKKGFTMAELLIVVAIIAVLVAIAIPVFTAQLNKAKAATDLANIRSGYASVTTTILTDSTITDGAKFYLNTDGTATKGDSAPATAYKCKGASSDADTTASIGQFSVGGTGGISWTKDNNVVYTIDVAADGTATIEKIEGK